MLLAHPALALDLSQDDKQKHFAVSALITSTAYVGVSATGHSPKTALPVSAAIAIGAGLLKEYAIDTQADPDDIKANLLGVGAALILPVMIEF